MRVLIVDRTESKLLEGEPGLEITRTVSTDDAVVRARAFPYAAALVRMRQLDPKGRGRLKLLTECRPRMPVIALLDRLSVWSAAEAIGDGVYECVTGRLTSHELAAILKKALFRTATRESPGAGGRRERERLGVILGAGKLMQRVYDRLERLAASNRHVILVGEPGTGSLLIAKAVHRLSNRRSGPFRSASCSGNSPALLAMRFFGHEAAGPGSPGGALEEARKGTLYISHVEVMPRTLEIGLQEALGSGAIRRPGNDSSQPLDVRLIASLGARGRGWGTTRMASDLLDGLGGAVIFIPPLRDRPGDIQELANRRLASCCREYGILPSRFSEGCLEALQSHEWPGNLRELEGVVRRAVLLSSGREIVPDDLELSWNLQEVINRHIRQVLTRTAGDKTRAARILGISRTCLYDRLQSHTTSTRRPTARIKDPTRAR